MIKYFEDYNPIELIRGVGNNNTGNVDLFGKGLYLTNDMRVAKFYGDKILRYSVVGDLFDTTKMFTPKELKHFCSSLDKEFNCSLGKRFLKETIDYNEGTIPDNIDYIGISWTLNSWSEFFEILKRKGLDTNQFNSYANTCTGMNKVLMRMGYVGLKYSTSEIDDLDDKGLGGLDAFLIFDNNSYKKINIS